MSGSSGTAYGWLTLAALFVSVAVWSRLTRRDPRLILIYLAALAGAYFGAKLVYFAAEGWLYWHAEDRWIKLATGKSIIGGLLGGYAAVELAKRLVHYDTVTGDRFAVVTPIAMMFGRVGCLVHGCCLGRHLLADGTRWPAAHIEFSFNVLALIVILVLRRKCLLSGQHFHIYIISYALFRILHEFLRATPQLLGPITGYQMASLVLLGFGLLAFRRRQRHIRAMVPVL